MGKKDAAPPPVRGAGSHDIEGMMRVTSVKMWVALSVIGAILTGVVIWSIFGSLPERIDGDGMLRAAGGVQQIRAAAAGRIRQLTIKVNDVVKNDQVIGTLAAVAMDENVKAAQAKYEEALRQYEMDRSRESLAISQLTGERGRKQGIANSTRQELATAADNLKKNLITRDQYDAVKRRYDFALSDVASVNDQLRTREANVARSAGRVAQAKTDLDRVYKTTSEMSEIRSAIGGRIVNVLRRIDDVVRPGEAIAEVESGAGGAELVAVGFIAARAGKKIAKGQRAVVAVSGFRAEEFGKLVGVVDAVSEFPESPAVIAREMKESEIEEACYRVTVKLTADPTTPSHFAWTNGVGPAEQIRTGTRVKVEVETHARAPITLIIPPKKPAPAVPTTAGANQPGS